MIQIETICIPKTQISSINAAVFRATLVSAGETLRFEGTFSGSPSSGTSYVDCQLMDDLTGVVAHPAENEVGAYAGNLLSEFFRGERPELKKLVIVLRNHDFNKVFTR